MTVDRDMIGPVRSLYEDYRGLVEDLKDRSPSGLAALNRTYHKVILVAAASSLENQVKKVIGSMFCEHGRDELGVFVTKRVMDRGYHQLFDWNAGKAKSFFGSFGPDCSKLFEETLKNDTEFEKQHFSFMRLGRLRNQLVHQDYATYALDETPDELFILYRTAALFPGRFEEIIFATAHGAVVGMR
ncbi:HEPN domain-containing protein [Nocardia arthritidis]|uniref:HEPN domain-containing protein n=1 Tax=Nocardia arthritidis TaxID=228602 RepID=UPI0012ED4CC9|nr:HEPN domain-containing protein [Nocardia arthritidis]